MKYVKQSLMILFGLVAIDQIVKIIIHYFFFYSETDILGNIIRFRPIHSTNLSWGGNYISLFSNMGVVVAINLLVIALFISGYSFYRSKKPISSIPANMTYVVGLAGSICSLVDKVIWGGSLDFIQIPFLFTFDIKDCYLTIAQCLFIYIGIKHHKEISVTEYIKWCFKKN